MGVFSCRFIIVYCLIFRPDLDDDAAVAASLAREGLIIRVLILRVLILRVLILRGFILRVLISSN